MIAYLDASVILRFVLGQPDSLQEWTEIEGGVSSRLVEVECLRTVDRLRHVGALSEEQVAIRRSGVFDLLDEVDLVDVTPAVLTRASQPFPTALGTLDAIHLATALLWADASGEQPMVATHDLALARAARACGLSVVGA